jgi:hypothetical protein
MARNERDVNATRDKSQSPVDIVSLGCNTYLYPSGDKRVRQIFQLTPRVGKINGSFSRSSNFTACRRAKR